MSRVIAISDIHAHAKTFKALVEDKVQLTKEDKLFLLGDYVHRGPDDEGVLDYIMELQTNNYQIEYLLGNHEYMWMQERSDQGITIPSKYMNFLENGQLYIEYQKFIFVHAGLDFSKDKPLSNYRNLVWIRDWYRSIDYNWLGNRTIIHGHTPVSESTIRKRVSNQKQAIGIDNGCFVDFKSGMGQICAFDLTNWELYFQKNLESNKKPFFSFKL